jgi:hypothetical protein
MLAAGKKTRTAERLWGSRKDPRNFRRHMTYFAQACDALDIMVNELHTYEEAVDAMAEAMEYMWAEKRRPATVIRDVKGAVSTTYAYVYGKQMSEHKMIQDLLKAYLHSNPPIKQPLKLKWKLKQLLDHFRAQRRPRYLEWDALIAKTACLLRIFVALRLTEAMQLQCEDTEPNEDQSEWEFVVQIKLKDHRDIITVHKNDDETIDPIAHLIELRERIRTIGEEAENGSFWIRYDGSAVRYETVRRSVVSVMHEAGIDDTHAYHLKHAALTALVEENALPVNITNFARHKNGSTTYLDNYAVMTGSKKCASVLAKL